MLAFPNFAREFLLETDASGKGLGAVLAQKQEDGSTRPIAYASCTLEPSEKNYGVTEVEALAVVWAMYTDHEALKSPINTLTPLDVWLAGDWRYRKWISIFTTGLVGKI